MVPSGTGAAPPRGYAVELESADEPRCAWRSPWRLPPVWQRGVQATREQSIKFDAAYAVWESCRYRILASRKERVNVETVYG